MALDIASTNPVVTAVIEGTAPRPAQVAASKGILPLPQADLLEILAAFATGTDEELRSNALSSLRSQENSAIEELVRASAVAPRVLAFYAGESDLPQSLQEAILTNPRTPPPSIVQFAATTSNGSLLELIAINQQLLIKTPAILDAIIANPNRTPEAERRAAEVKREFFEKERGAEQ
ncbi:MAG TPA: hypothetical protein VL501_08350, partial [Pyrinomonadaceae bacterium]|nr:hypothetical protein [Pyrinomonadaceae bacterium]